MRTLLAAALASAAVGSLAAAPAHASILPTFAESGYTAVYDVMIGDRGFPGYDYNAAAAIASGSFDRIGYMLQLQATGSNTVQWVAVSMDAFTNNAALIGVPTSSSDSFVNTPVAGMNVQSNVAGVPIGTNLSGGVIAFWPSCYAAPAGGFATGLNSIQTGTSCTYGSMQVGLLSTNGASTTSQTILAYNEFTEASSVGASVDVGIGNDPQAGLSSPRGTAQGQDWTFAGNAPSYQLKQLTVFVQETAVPEPATAALLAVGFAGMIGLRRRRRAA